jgi:SAM-dependent methyltransferase
MKRFVLSLLNNFIVNRFLILFRRDEFIKKYVNNWSKKKFNFASTLQENVGFTENEDVNTAISKIHEYVRVTDVRYLNEQSMVLDIGCGVGLYLKDFRSKNLYGIDMSADFLEQCAKVVPSAKTFLGDYMSYDFEQQYFDMVMSVSVLEYIPPSKLSHFLMKIWKELKPGGIVLIQYPHALSVMDKLYNDLSYVSYTPSAVESSLKGKFNVLVHEHSFDKRKVRGVDTKHYGVQGQKHFCNGMILIAQRAGV